MPTSRRDAALLGLGAVAGAGLALAAVRRRQRPATAAAAATTTAPASLPAELETELWSRNSAFFGEAGHAKVRGATVAVIGLGGVGSHAAHMLARSGVGTLKLVDFDMVSLSSLNRHATARLKDVGLSKGASMAAALGEVVPGVRVEAIKALFSADNAAALLTPKPDYVVDCIDDTKTKAELIAYCLNHDIRVVTALSAGAKADPTKLNIGRLVDAPGGADPLASKIRWRLRKLGIHDHASCKVDACYSYEKPWHTLLPLNSQQEAQPEEFGQVREGRRCSAATTTSRCAYDARPVTTTTVKDDAALQLLLLLC